MIHTYFDSKFFLFLLNNFCIEIEIPSIYIRVRYICIHSEYGMLGTCSLYLNKRNQSGSFLCNTSKIQYIFVELIYGFRSFHGFW